MLKRLGETQHTENEDGIVTALVSRMKRAARSIDGWKKFEGSLPAFIAAFANGRLSASELDEVQQMIDRIEGSNMSE